MGDQPLDLRAVEAHYTRELDRVGITGNYRAAVREILGLLAALRATRAALVGMAHRTLVNGTACWCTLLEPDEAGNILHSAICQERRAALATARDEP